MDLVYQTKVYCKNCDKEIEVNLYSDILDILERFPGIKKDVEEQGDWSHWVHTHRLCAVCGKLVEKGLDLVIERDYKGIINKQYLESLKYPDRGLLTVHATCIE